ncbi:COP23 domain-containing protein [Anabaena sp. UHCC 0204]|jgi:hypothetical protein|uniref:COP23 domain-containing protein n=1 Tax=Anabaena sp. UHCC 0204 TaxID=2590009 RepID=UPI0014481653|nr:COP23 domain-containing protein [Anabaena sp. UHCC 0204]MTJ06558.1 hypothetical protein [Anabaena sp. UHCC 0204]
MLRKSLAILSGAVIVSSLGAAVSSPSYADPGGPFSCDTNNLTTVVGAGRATVMRWRTNEFAGSGYDRVRRCMEVSSRFNHFYSAGQLNYITAGMVRGMPVVCAASPGASCDSSNVLFTLNRRNSRNVAGILQTLFDNRAGATGAVVNESSGRVYIDVNKMLSDLGVDSNRSAQQKPSVVNNKPSTTPSGGGW